MAEVFHFDECLIKTISGTVETRIDTYAQNAAIALKKTFFDVTDESGQIVKRYEEARGADLSIDTLFASEISHTDGNAIRVYYGNILGTTTYELGSAYVADKGWAQSENSTVTHDIKVVGRTFGTV